MSTQARVIIVEDSSSCRLLLEAIVESDDRLELVASYESAEDAIAKLEEDQPDVISLDIELPGINGLEATRLILQSHPIPIVIVSSTVSRDQVKTSMKAMEAGALAVLAKPSDPDSKQFDRDSRHMCSTLMGMSQVKVIKQHAHRQPGGATKTPRASSLAKAHSPQVLSSSSGMLPSTVIAVGASTGGPPALELLIKNLPSGNLPPILIVQHISPGFVEGLASWLADRSGHDVQLAQEGELLRSGMVRMAPDGLHMRLGRSGRVQLTPEPRELLHCPSVDVLFESVARALGSASQGVLLTGMGSDGAEGLLKIREQGGWSAVQDEKSSVVYGMPRVALERNAVLFQGSPTEIALQIQRRNRHGNT